MKTLGGGWTILQRRGDFGRNKNYFLRNWNDYKNGFGDPVEDVWLGLEAAHHLTKESEFQLMVVLQDFDNNSTSLIVNNFTIGPEEEGYKISYKNYNSKIGNSLPARGTKFSTIDTDNDAWSKNCAKRFSGAWWYSACHNSNLNGLYLRGPHESFGNGVNWYHWRGYNYSLKFSEMKIRPYDAINGGSNDDKNNLGGTTTAAPGSEEASQGTTAATAGTGAAAGTNGDAPATSSDTPAPDTAQNNPGS